MRFGGFGVLVLGFCRAVQATSYCLDAALELHFDEESIARAQYAELKEKLRADRSCLRHQANTAVIDNLQRRIPSMESHAVDCMGLSTPDEQDKKPGMLSIVSICSKTQDARTDEWESGVHQLLEKAYPTGADDNRIAMGDLTALVSSVMISDGYELPTGTGMPSFELLHAEFNIDSFSKASQVDLTIGNNGKVPLYVFGTAATHRETHESTIFMAKEVATILPSQSQSIAFTSSFEMHIGYNESIVLYVGHSSFLAHRFTGVVQDVTFLFEAPASFGRSVFQARDGTPLDPSTLTSDVTSLFPSFPYSAWKVYSIVLVVVVAITTVLYVRRKWARKIRLVCGSSQIASRVPTREQRQQQAQASGYTPSTSDDIGKQQGASHTGIEMGPVKSASTKTVPTEWGLNTEAGASWRPKTKLPLKKPLKQPTTTQTPPSRSVSAVSERKQVQAKPSYTLVLDEAIRSLSGQEFERLWEEYVERSVATFQLSSALDGERLVQKMEEHHVACIASGAVDGTQKFVFYGKVKGEGDYLLETVDVTSTFDTSLHLRTSRLLAGNIVQAFEAFVRQQVTSCMQQ